MQCEMCGRETTKLYRVRIEGSILNVCKSCARYGTIIGTISNEKREQKKKEVVKERIERDEEIEVIVNDYAEKIRNAREKKGLKQEELAKILAIKDSLLHKFESNRMEPPIDIAKRIEKVLDIKLIEKVMPKHIEKIDEKKKELTLGDVVRIRERKK